MKKQNKRIIIWGIIGLVVLLVILRKTGVIGGVETIKVAVENVSSRDIIETVSASGKIQPVREVKLSPDVSGEIVELLVKEGDLVKEGQVLARVKPDIYQANYEQIAANVNSQKANLSNAEARLSQTEAQFLNTESSYKRNKTLFDQGVISNAEFDAAQAQFDVAKAEVQASKQTVNAAKFNVYSAQASMSEASKNLSRTTIVAPVDGTISTLNVEVGERVAGASQFGSGTEILRIADMAEMEVMASVNENEVVRLSLGDTAIVDVDAYPNKKFKGIVTEIGNSANVSGISADQVSNFDVTIQILSSSYADMIPKGAIDYSPFRPGMSASVEIQTEKVKQVLSVPVQSVTTRDESDVLVTDDKEKKEKKNDQDAVTEFVFVIENGIAKRKTVKTGVQDNEYIQILEGLKKDEVVIVAPYSAIAKKLQGDEKVEVVDRKNLFEVN
ncbi:MAG TPA: efflux RND transporter periplasmic adaptor subunit [Bacteroidales bacterium]|nr:efflux RND transporter periplasmic adaptor subunit [Bacteroidales bacterium]HCB62097.1 efflux RND transporter periplasmic adaptor subunit [Bacteroidales bacterium]HCY22325.1 efflux RND transporter periplasmic adaptor subunit [Bacteroidales bacterium]